MLDSGKAAGDVDHRILFSHPYWKMMKIVVNCKINRPYACIYNVKNIIGIYLQQKHSAYMCFWPHMDYYLTLLRIIIQENI